MAYIPSKNVYGQITNQPNNFANPGYFNKYGDYRLYWEFVYQNNYLYCKNDIVWHDQLTVRAGNNAQDYIYFICTREMVPADLDDKSDTLRPFTRKNIASGCLTKDPDTLLDETLTKPSIWQPLTLYELEQITKSNSDIQATQSDIQNIEDRLQEYKSNNNTLVYSLIAVSGVTFLATTGIILYNILKKEKKDK